MKYTLPNEVNLCTKVNLDKGERYVVRYEVYANEDSELIPIPLNVNVEGSININNLTVVKE